MIRFVCLVTDKPRDQIISYLTNVTFIKWDHVFSSFLDTFDVRQASVLSPILFALYIDDISKSIILFQRCHIMLCADDCIRGHAYA